MKQKIKIVQTIIFIFFISFPFYANAMTVEEFIKGRKAMFSENYQNAKKILGEDKDRLFAIVEGVE